MPIHRILFRHRKQGAKYFFLLINSQHCTFKSSTENAFHTIYLPKKKSMEKNEIIVMNKYVNFISLQNLCFFVY